MAKVSINIQYDLVKIYSSIVVKNTHKGLGFGPAVLTRDLPDQWIRAY